MSDFIPKALRLMSIPIGLFFVGTVYAVSPPGSASLGNIQYDCTDKSLCTYVTITYLPTSKNPTVTGWYKLNMGYRDNGIVTLIGDAEFSENDRCNDLGVVHDASDIDDYMCSILYTVGLPAGPQDGPSRLQLTYNCTSEHSYGDIVPKCTGSKVAHSYWYDIPANAHVIINIDSVDSSTWTCLTYDPYTKSNCEKHAGTGEGD